MRPIKFRAWKDGIKYYVRALDWWGESVDNIQVCDETLDGKWLYTWDALEQFTGINDKHCVEVYEGDILEVHDAKLDITFRGVVEYADGSFCIRDTTGNRHFRWQDYELERIGNIHENAEMLTYDEDNHGYAYKFAQKVILDLKKKSGLDG